MVQVAVGNLIHLPGLGIDDHEQGRGAEMTENNAFQAIVAFYRETDFHGNLLGSFCV
jgi:hypothetical protein